MSVYGPTGATAYFGMVGIGKPKEGETVVVSAAAGATGSVAGQIAKIAGARVVGIAGGPEKCKAVVEDFGFDACIDYREDDLKAALKQHCPRGVDVYFDNVGGPILDAVLGRLAPKARVVLCGVISSYLTGEHPGPANYVNLLAKTATMQGFNALDEWGRFDEAFGPLREWAADGKLVHRQTIYDGIESCVDAMNGLFTGANIGKMLVKISEPTISLSTPRRKGVQTGMIFNVLRLLGVAVTTAAALLIAPVPNAAAQGCPDVEVVFARGTAEPPGVGGVGQAFVDAVRAQAAPRSVNVYAVNYAASSDFMGIASRLPGQWSTGSATRVCTSRRRRRTVRTPGSCSAGSPRAQRWRAM